MPDPKPGSEAAPAGSAPPPPPEAAPETTATPQAPPPTPPATQAQDVQTPEPLPATAEEFRARLEAERKKVLDEYRAKAGEEGGWMKVLSEDDREFLKRNPSALREMKAKVEAYETALAGLGRKPEPEKQEPDPLEAEAAELVELAKDEKIEPKVFYRRMVEVQAKIARREAQKVHAEQFHASYSNMTREQQSAAVMADPRMKDPVFKTHLFGVVWREQNSGKSITPLEALELTAKEMGSHSSGESANGHAAPAPKVTPALGETRTSANSAPSPSLSLYERYAKTPSGKRLDGAR